jgi:hypothetical protein
MSAWRSRFCVASIATLIGFSAPALANEKSPGIEGINTESGETELEFKSQVLDTTSGTGLNLQLQGEHALSSAWAMGAELDLQREPAERLKVDTLRGWVTWRAPNSVKETSLAFRAGGGFDFGEGRPLLEAAVFAGWVSGKWTVSAKLDIESLLGAQASPELGYRGRVVRTLSQGMVVGIEGAGDFPSANVPEHHRLGPVIQMPLGKNETVILEMGAFVGLNYRSPTMLYRLEMAFAF